MFLNQRHHKIFTTPSVTVSQSLQTTARNSQSVQFTVYTNIFLSVSYEDKRNTDNMISFAFQSPIQTYQLCICFFFKRWNSVEKIPWGRNILLFFFLMRKKPLQTLAGSVWVCYHFCWWLGTVSQGTRRYSMRPFQFACAAVTLWK